MELQQYLRIVGRYWRSTLAVFLACVAAAAVLTLLQKPTYTSTASLFLVVQSGETAGELSQGATYAERQVKSYIDVATSTVVLQPTIDELQLNVTPRQLAEKLKVSSPAATSIIDVAAEDPSPERASETADSVSKQLLAAVDQLSPAGPDGAKLVSATVIDPARVSTKPVSPRPSLNLALGALAGLLLGLGQSLGRSSLDTRLRTQGDLAAIGNAPLLASIGGLGRGERAATGQTWANDEAYRRLRTNIGFVGLGGERKNSMIVTSSVAGEGKTETITNLARVLADAGDKVVLVDADLRRPQVCARMNLDGELGLSDVLSGRADLLEVLLPSAHANLQVLAAGTVPPNPSELLGSAAMSALLLRLEKMYDHVLFDTPPVLPVTDAVVLGARTGGAILVARSGVVRSAQFRDATELLNSGGTEVLGVVLNDAPARGDGGYGAYYEIDTSAATARRRS